MCVKQIGCVKITKLTYNLHFWFSNLSQRNCFYLKQCNYIIFANHFGDHLFNRDLSIYDPHVLER